MSLDKKFEDLFLNVSIKAALSSYHFVGKKDKIAADKAAVDSMRSNLNNLDIQGQIVIGEGELDEAPMLYIGEKLGTNKGPEFDIAVDPLEGTNFAANNLPGALSVIAVTEKNNLFKAPETYMEKISTKAKEKLPVKYNESSVLDLVDNEIFLENRNEVKKYLPEILGRVLARIWIDENFKDTFKKDPLKALSDNGVFLPDEMFLEFQKPDTKRPKIVVYERKGKSNFKVRVVQLQLIMMAGR